MMVRINGRMVDVSRKDCANRTCFVLGFDKGTYVQGRGYTSYHKKERPVCFTRFMHGCPMNSICPVCRFLSVDEPGSHCEHQDCAGITEVYNGT